MSQSYFSADSSLNVDIPKVSQKSIDIYERYIDTGIRGAEDPKKKDLSIYESYIMYK